MNKPSMNLQDSFLNQVRKDGSQVKIVMLDGSQLTGFVRGFDNFTVVFYSQGMQHLLYKHAIAQVVARKSERREADSPRHKDDAPAGKDDSSAPAESSSARSPFNGLDLSGIETEPQR